MAKEKFDLADLDTRAKANEGYDLEILHPVSQEEIGLTVHILGSDSKEYQKIVRATNSKRMDRLRKAGGLRNADIPLEEIEKDSVDLLVSCSTGWKARGGLMLDGKEWPAFTKPVAAGLYDRFPWLREQIDRGIVDRGNFIKG